MVEHLDPPRLSAFERVLFEFARPAAVVLTTPNAEYNVKWETLPAGNFRHRDHRFEWTRAEFRAWAERVADRFGYVVRFLPVGPEDPVVGPPTQLGVFTLRTDEPMQPSEREQQDWMERVDQARERARRELGDRRPPPSEEIIRQMREERDAQILDWLSPEDPTEEPPTQPPVSPHDR